MMKLLVLVFAALSAFGVCQMDVMGMMRKMKSAPVMLIQMPDVKKELKLNGDQNKKIGAIQKEFQETTKKAQSGGMAAMSALPAETDKASQAVLEVLDADQVVRVHQIQYQMWGAASLYEPDVQTALQLTPEQVAKITEWQEGETSRMMELVQGQRGGNDTKKKMDKMRETDTKTLMAILTPEQAAKLKELQGPPSNAAKKLSKIGF